MMGAKKKKPPDISSKFIGPERGSGPRKGPGPWRLPLPSVPSCRLGSCSSSAAVRRAGFMGKELTRAAREARKDPPPAANPSQSPGEVADRVPPAGAMIGQALANKPSYKRLLDTHCVSCSLMR